MSSVREENGVVYIEFIGVGVGQVFKEADDIVAEKTDSAAAKTWKIG